MSSFDTCINLHYRPNPEMILADCRNQIEVLQNLAYMASLEAVWDSAQHLNIAMIECRLNLLADALFLPA